MAQCRCHKHDQEDRDTTDMVNEDEVRVISIIQRQNITEKENIVKIVKDTFAKQLADKIKDNPLAFYSYS